MKLLRPRRNDLRRLALPLLMLLTTVACGSSDDPKDGGPSRDAIRAAGRALAAPEVKLPPPEKGEWLDEHKEPGQSFDQYLASNPNRPTAKRTTLYVQPLGEFQGREKELLARTVEMLGLFYDMPVKTLDPIGLDVLPKEAHRVHPRWGVKQVDSLAVLQLLRTRRPDDAVAVLALTTSDLWPNDKVRAWNFVFGQASLRDRVGVWSIARYGDLQKEYPLALQRTLKVALHETGHMLGMFHCVAHKCGMNGSNHLPEADRQPMAFCSECEMKVWWSCRSEIAGRYDRLTAFADANGLIAEAKAWRAAQKLVGGAPSR